MIVHAVLFFRKDISSCLIGEDKKHEIRFKQIERMLKNKNS